MTKQKEEAMTAQEQQDEVDRAVREMVRQTPWILGGIPDKERADASHPVTEKQEEHP